MSLVLAILIKYSALIRYIEYSSKGIASIVVEGLTYYIYSKKGYIYRIYP